MSFFLLWLYSVIFRGMANNGLRCAARILIRKGNIEAAHRVLERVYSEATAEQIDLQVFLAFGQPSTSR